MTTSLLRCALYSTLGIYAGVALGLLLEWGVR